MVHQPSGGFQGQVTDILIHAKEVEGLKRRLNQIYEKHTGRTYEEIETRPRARSLPVAGRGQGIRHHRQVFEKRAVPDSPAAERVNRVRFRHGSVTLA